MIGYCKCDHIVKLYQEKTFTDNIYSLLDVEFCNCYNQIVYNGKNHSRYMSDSEYLSIYESKVHEFRVGYREVLHFERVQGNHYLSLEPIYLVVYLNVMNVKQTSKNVYDVGLDINLISFAEVSNALDVKFGLPSLVYLD